ncbi:SRPBCC family protein [Cellulomonas fimi]|uniref:SRPBCC family protein n=1 Tax=Cellulomonas fimi TaxID=1708 RepID=UPI00234E0E33|nr:SRPBCC family protein [Cellulomonas fimi]MDC7121662.1 SRPBCC family protein [Cellulomonas fimi]
MTTTTRVLPLPAARAWDLVADARNHARWIPLTRVDVADGYVVAVSGPRAQRGGGGLVDRMRIDRFDPPHDDEPGVAEFTKVGRVLRGTARIEVAAAGPDAARVTWTESVHLAGPLPAGLTRAVGAPLLELMVRRALRMAAHEAAREAVRGG